MQRNEKEYIIITGDLNRRIGNAPILGVTQRFNEEHRNNNGEQLLQFCSDNGLQINKTFSPHKIKHKFTWRNTRGQSSRIEYIIITEK
jgi:hypothetical protein